MTGGGGGSHVGAIEKVERDGAGSMGAGMLGKVVRARELLAALVALEGLVLGVERTVVTLEVFLAAEPAVALLADEGLGGILGQGLLATTAVGGSSGGAGGGVSGIGRSGVGTRVVVLGLAGGVVLVGRGLGLVLSSP